MKGRKNTVELIVATGLAWEVPEDGKRIWSMFYASTKKMSKEFKAIADAVQPIFRSIIAPQTAESGLEQPALLFSLETWKRLPTPLRETVGAESFVISDKPVACGAQDVPCLMDGLEIAHRKRHRVVFLGDLVSMNHLLSNDMVDVIYLFIAQNQEDFNCYDNYIARLHELSSGWINKEHTHLGMSVIYGEMVRDARRPCLEEYDALRSAGMLLTSRRTMLKIEGVDAAARLKIPPLRLVDIEAGKEKPSNTEIVGLSNICKLDLQYLLRIYGATIKSY